MKKSPRISVVISTYNRCNDLKRCFDSLLEQTYRDFEIVIIDGDSTDGTKELVKSYSNKHPTTFMIQEKEGVYPAWNEALRNCQGEIVTYIDDDTICSQEYLKAIVDTFAISNGIAGVSGPTIMPKNKMGNRGFLFFQTKLSQMPDLIRLLFGKIYTNIILEGKPQAVGRFFRSGAFSPGSNFLSCLALKELCEVDYVEACNMSYRKDLIKKLGGFNDKIYTLEFSEDELCFQLRRRGYKLIFNPKAAVKHMVNPSGGATRTNAIDRSKDFIFFYFRNIKLDSLDKLLRFNLNLMFWNGYWLYKFATTKNVDWLTGITGIIKGIAYAFALSKV